MRIQIRNPVIFINLYDTVFCGIPIEVPYYFIIFVYSRFAYMMMRRYADAIRTFSNILLYVQRTKQMFQVESYHYLCSVFRIRICIQSGQWIRIRIRNPDPGRNYPQK
jgi:hypothetical protein